MIELVYRPQADLFGDMPDVTEVTMTLGDNISWEAALEEFIHFLKASGYEPPENPEEELAQHAGSFFNRVVEVENRRVVDGGPIKFMPLDPTPEKPAWIPLKITERNRIIEEWQSLTKSVRPTIDEHVPTKDGPVTRLCKMIEDKLKELNT